MRKENHMPPVSEQGKQTSAGNKPSLPRHLFWDQRYEELDWTNGYRSIIARVIERGNQQDWEEMLRFYGRPKVVNALINEIKYLPDYAIEDVSRYFNLRKEQLLCYNRKQLRRGHWI